MKIKFALLFIAIMLTQNIKAQFIKGFEIDFKAGIGYTNTLETTEARVTGDLGTDIGLIFDYDISGGLFYNHFNTTSRVDDYLGEKFLFRSNYTGIYLKKTFFPRSFVHFSIPVRIGIGGANYSNHVVTDYDGYDDDSVFHLHEKEDKCFIYALEPGIQVEFNLADEAVRLGTGVSYRKLGNLHLNYGDGYKIASGCDLDGPVFNVSLIIAIE
ncbi:MAG: hypothetical protein MJ211_04950 [Bacteroidales bacterium]|nr:hypothetical protein [Bacteroidales bacterium]